MRGAIMVAMTVLAASAAHAETENFDGQKAGAAPAGWMRGHRPRQSVWTVEADRAAPSAPRAAPSGSGTFPLVREQGVALTDGFIEVKFKPGGRRTRRSAWSGAGRTATTHVARASALENNVSLSTPRRSHGPIKPSCAGAGEHYQRARQIRQQADQGGADGKAYLEARTRRITGRARSVWTSGQRHGIRVSAMAR
jgi:hypothetical protein